MSSGLILVPLRAAYRHSDAVEQCATYHSAAKVLLLIGGVLSALSAVIAVFPVVGGWMALAASGVALASSFWLFERSAKLRGSGVGCLRITFADTDAMREAGVPVEWIKKLEQGDVLIWSEEDRAAYKTANAAVSAAKQRK